METIGLTPKFQTYIEVERQTDISETGSKTMAYTLKPGLTTINQKASTETKRIKEEIYQVYTKGTEEEISWIFQLKTEKAILEGILQAEQLGILELKSKSCMIEATFEVEDKDVRITQTSGLWDQDMSLEEKGMLETEFYSEFIKPLLRPYVSRVELCHE
ncbi:hypothetical protein [Xenococcus sp. PCC 7305]|uniref:hypothetical protein n=1 Tax=Xenococcus sp. PCC 7305 TaxID=102125 RepID=UPI000302D693|nr:hypothetical protein [Xenococcus sp. PCC 7305]